MSRRTCTLRSPDGIDSLFLVRVLPDTPGSPIHSGWVTNGAWMLRRQPNGIGYEAWDHHACEPQEPRTTGIDLSGYTIHDDVLQEEEEVDDGYDDDIPF